MTNEDILAYLVQNTMEGVLKWVRIQTDIRAYRTTDPTYNNRTITVLFDMDERSAFTMGSSCRCKISTDGVCLMDGLISPNHLLIYLLIKEAHPDELHISTYQPYAEHITSHIKSDVDRYLKYIDLIWSFMYLTYETYQDEHGDFVLRFRGNASIESYEGKFIVHKHAADDEKCILDIVLTRPEERSEQFTDLPRPYINTLVSIVKLVSNNIRTMDL